MWAQRLALAILAQMVSVSFVNTCLPYLVTHTLSPPPLGDLETGYVLFLCCVRSSRLALNSQKATCLPSTS